MIRRPILALLPALLLLVLGGFNIARKIAWVEPTDGIEWETRAGGVTAAKVEPGSHADLAGIKPGAVLFSINRDRVRTRIDVIKSQWQAFGRDRRVTYEVNTRDGYLIFPSFYLQRKATPLTYYYMAGVGVVSLVLSLLVLLGAQRSLAPPQTFFFLVSLAFSAAFLLSPTGALDTLDMVIYAVDKAAFLAYPPLLYHFFRTFPLRKGEPGSRRTTPFLAYLPAAAMLLGSVAHFLPWFESLGDAQVLRYRDLLERLELAHFGFFSVLALAVVWAGVRKAPSVFLQKQLRLIGSGLGLGVLPVTLFYVVPFLAGRTPSPVAELSALLEVLVPLTFAYAISRQRAREFEVMLKKGVTLAFSFFVIAVLYFFVGTQTRILAENRLNVIILGVLAMFLGATLFTPLKKLVQTLLDRAIYRRSYEYRRTLLLISKQLSRERNLQTLADALLEAIANALSLRTIALLIAGEKDGGSLEVVSARGEAADLPPRLPLDEESARLLRERDHLACDSDDRRPFPRALVPLVSRGISHLLPLSVEDKLVGLLVMGRKADGSFFAADDWVLLTTISPSVALALENAWLYNRETVRALEMQRLKDYSENIIESLTVGVAVTDRDGRVIGWNRVLEGVFGRAKADVLGRRLAEAVGPANAAALFPTETQRDYRLLSEISLDTGPGGRRIFDIARTPLLDNRLQAYGTITVFEDVTDKMRLQQQLVTSEKLASIGLLSAGVAHEINTPLTGISSYIQMLQKTLTDAHYAQILGKIEVQTDRVARIIKNLLAFARSPAESAFHRVDLKASLEEIVSLIDYKLRTLRITLEMDLRPTPPLYAQGERLQQVFINIILNALDAMPDGGTLRIELRPGAGGAVVRIVDTGTGIKPEHRPHIFDPFFTTKGIGKGTGLGLSISYAIVKEHDGAIEVESEPGRGTAFTIAIPGDLDRRKAGRPAAATAPAAPAPAAPAVPADPSKD